MGSWLIQSTALHHWFLNSATTQLVHILWSNYLVRIVKISAAPIMLITWIGLWGTFNHLSLQPWSCNFLWSVSDLMRKDARSDPGQRGS